MASKAIAVIAGAGPGTGASIARRFAQAYPVALLARNPKNYEGLVDEITRNGGKAIGISTDVSDANSIKNAFVEIDKVFPALPLAAAVYNVGGGFSMKPFLELGEDEFTQAFKITGLGGFLFSQAVIPRLLKSTALEKPPTLIFTGATASLKGSAKLSSFAAGKFALRALAQSLAREFGPQGVHVCHAIVDGIIDIERTSQIKFESPDSKLDPGAIAESYWNLHLQPRTTFTHELDLRPYAEKW